MTESRRFRDQVNAIRTLVNICLSLMDLLILLVEESVLGSSGARSQVGVIVLGDVLVHLLRGCRAGALDGLGDVVDSVLATAVRDGNKEDKESLV